MTARTKAEMDALVLGQLRERDFRQQVVDYARLLGWKVWFVWSSIHSPSGWPDLFCIHPARVEAFAAELKTEKGRVTAAQLETLGLLKAIGIRTYLWRPSMWAEIEAVLKGEKGE